MKSHFKIYILCKAVEGALFNEYDWIWAFTMIQLIPSEMDSE